MGGTGKTMRVMLVALGASAIALLPAAAGAAPRADYKQTFTTPVPGASTGTDTQILYKHPDDPNAKPIPVRQEVFTFPEGTQFDNTVAPVCTASERELEARGESACPPESRMGGGKGTMMTGFPGPPETPMDVDGFNTEDGMLLLGGASGFPVRSAARARRRGRVTTVDVPRLPGGPPDGASAIRRVHNVFPPRSSGERAYTRTPSVCPASGTWTFHARVTYADGVAEEYTHAMPCRREAQRPRVRVRVGGVPRACVRRAFRVRVRVFNVARPVRVRVRLDGRLVRQKGARRFRHVVRARSLRRGRHRLVVTVDAAGQRTRRTVRFRRCA